MDREKVISEFEDFVKSFSKRDDTYYKGLFVSVLALLKEQEAVVRCKDCKHRYNGCCYNKETKRINFTIEVPDDWFCADGELR